MKGDAKVIEYLNAALRSELTAVSQYWLHYRLQEDWGFGRIAAKSREESIEEMHHADSLIERIIFPRRPPEPAEARPAAHRPDPQGNAGIRPCRRTRGAHALHRSARPLRGGEGLRVKGPVRNPDRRRRRPYRLHRDAAGAAGDDRRRQLRHASGQTRGRGGVNGTTRGRRDRAAQETLRRPFLLLSRRTGLRIDRMRSRGPSTPSVKRRQARDARDGGSPKDAGDASPRLAQHGFIATAQILRVLF
jgi:hypothetical protein